MQVFLPTDFCLLFFYHSPKGNELSWIFARGPSRKWLRKQRGSEDADHHCLRPGKNDWLLWEWRPEKTTARQLFWYLGIQRDWGSQGKRTGLIAMRCSKRPFSAPTFSSHFESSIIHSSKRLRMHLSGAYYTAGLLLHCRYGTQSRQNLSPNTACILLEETRIR